MAKGIGRLISLGIGRETTRGTAVTPNFWIPFSDLDIQEKDEKALDEATVGVIEDSVGQTIVKQWAEGKWKAPIGDRHFPLILYATLGTIQSATKSGETTVYDHNISVQQSAQHQSLTIGIDDPLSGQDYRHALGVISSLEINYELGKILEYGVTIKAKKGEAANLTPSQVAENKFIHKHFTFKMAADQASLDAAQAMNIRSLTLKIEKNIDEDLALGNLSPVDFLNKQLSIEGTIEAVWQNETDFKQAALAGTKKAIRLDLVNTDVTIGTASNPRIKIDLHKVIFKEITKAVKLNDIVMQTLSFKAHYYLSDAKMISVLCNNTVSSY
ncbi:MAG: hypothetical protein KatS3mg101_1108 [Patescibacteria group bacterium]|nr:MAG: hypothetical protein KatS3mg101_1108 [Patescibacteria group bacterium]